jgi:prephenate dehydratase
MEARVPKKDPSLFKNRYMKIAIQGEKGCFHEMAARQYFENENIEIVPCSSFDLTLKSVTDGVADLAMMAIENARSGAILYNYSLIRESGLKMLGEHNLRIRQNLMALPGQTIHDIRQIRSHPIAIAQCMTYLNQYPAITLVEAEDTAGSAKLISDHRLKKIAAIASSAAAELYGLEILAHDIETYPKNYTRFLVIGSEDKTIQEGNKVSVCFSTGHKPGSLATVLVILAHMDINLTKIQSVPRLNGNWEYMFYLDLELPPACTIDSVQAAIKPYTSNMEVLGIYKKGDKLYES